MLTLLMDVNCLISLERQLLKILCWTIAPGLIRLVYQGTCKFHWPVYKSGKSHGV